MALSVFVLILISVALNTAAQFFLRKAMLIIGPQAPEASLHYVLTYLLQPWLMGGLACYVFSLLVWLAVLSKAEVSTAYPFLSIGYVLAAIAGFFFLGENVTATRAFGIALICGGLVFISRSA